MTMPFFSKILCSNISSKSLVIFFSLKGGSKKIISNFFFEIILLSKSLNTSSIKIIVFSEQLKL